MSVETLYDEIIAYCQTKLPEEACGFIFKDGDTYSWKGFENIYEGDKSQFFAIAPSDTNDAYTSGKLYAVFHSHTQTKDVFSQADVESQKRTGVAWVLFNIHGKPEVYWLKNEKKYRPLYDRPYVWHVYDCYSFIKDFYKQEFDIFLNDYVREENFFDKGQELYLDNFEKEGFHEVPLTSIKYGDILLFKLANSDVTSHAGVYMDNNIFAHHLNGRRSKKDLLGRFYKDRISKVIRHKDLT